MEGRTQVGSPHVLLLLLRHGYNGFALFCGRNSEVNTYYTIEMLDCSIS